MLHEYSNLYFPICSLIVSLLIFALYFSKKNVKNNETKLYSALLKLTLIEAIFTFLLTLSVHLLFNENTTVYFAIANKILYSIYIKVCQDPTRGVPEGVTRGVSLHPTRGV